MVEVEGYQPENQELTVGSAIGKVLHTDIETYLEDVKVESFNINGSTAIYVDALSILGIDYAWDGENRQVLIKRGPRKIINQLDSYEKVKFTQTDDGFVMDHSTLPDEIREAYEGYKDYTSNLYTEAFTDDELFQRNYNPLNKVLEQQQVK